MNPDSGSGSVLDPKRRALFEKLLRQEKAGSTSSSTISRRANSDSAPLSFTQERLWFLDQLEPNSAVYNLPLGLRLDGELDAGILQRSLEEVVRCHEVLRTCFQSAAGSLLQVVEPVRPIEMPIVDLSELPQHERAAEARRLCTKEAQRPFDLRRAPMLRATLFRLTPRQHVLSLNLHHVAADDWSIEILLRE